jgi:hypothetical protein
MWRKILSFWNGNEELWNAFWIVGICSNIVTEIGLGAAFNATEYYNITSLGLLILILIPYIAIKVWTIVSVWRCAPNTSNKIWCWIARGIIILSISNVASKMSAVLREIATSS